jgi:hypothetical protein
VEFTLLVQEKKLYGFKTIIYLAKEDTKKAYLNIYVIEGETWSALLRWNQDVPWIKNRATLWLWGPEATKC